MSDTIIILNYLQSPDDDKLWSTALYKCVAYSTNEKCIFERQDYVKYRYMTHICNAHEHAHNKRAVNKMREISAKSRFSTMDLKRAPISRSWVLMA